MITTPWSPPAPVTDRTTPELTETTTTAQGENISSPQHTMMDERTPLLMSPPSNEPDLRWMPLPSPAQITLGSPRTTMPPPKPVLGLLRMPSPTSTPRPPMPLQTSSPSPSSPIPGPQWMPPPVLLKCPLTPNQHLEPVGEEGQFDDTKEGVTGEPPSLPPCEQSLPPSPSPTPSPPPQSGQVTQMVWRILSEHQTSREDTLGTVLEPPEVPECPRNTGVNDADLPTAAGPRNPPKTPCSPDCQGQVELSSPAYIPLPQNIGQGTLIKCLFAPDVQPKRVDHLLPQSPGIQDPSLPYPVGQLDPRLRTTAAPRMVCPSSVPNLSTMARNASGPLPTLSLLPSTYVCLMTMDVDIPSSPSLERTPIQAALDKVSLPKRKTSFPLEQPIPDNLALPKPYSMPVPLPRMSPVTPVADAVPVVPVPSPVDSEGSLQLNSIPVAELMNAHLPEDASLMPIILSGPGLHGPGAVMKLLVSAPKTLRHQYGWSQNQ